MDQYGADSDTGYLYSVAIYYGKETMLVSRPGLNNTTRVVLTLVQPVSNMGYDLYTDRFYISPLFAGGLANLGNTLTGTVMAYRKDMPLAIRAKWKRKRGATKTYHKQYVCHGVDRKKNNPYFVDEERQWYGRHSFEVRCLPIGMWVNNNTYII